MGDESLHIIGSTILDIIDDCDVFTLKTEDIKDEFEILNKVLIKNNIDYSKLRSVLTPTANIYSFVFNADKVKSSNYISPYINKIINFLEDGMNAIFLTGDLIVDKHNFGVYSNIFAKNGFPNDYILKNDIFMIDVISITSNYYEKLTNELKNDDAFLFSMDICEPSIEKYAMTYLLPQKFIKYGRYLIYSVADEGDKANYTLVDNSNNYYKLVPIDNEVAYYTFLVAKPYQFKSRLSELKNSIMSIFNIKINGYPKIEIDDEKLNYVKKHSNINIEKNELCTICDESLRRNQIYHISENIHEKDSEVIFNLPVFYLKKDYVCSLKWNLKSNIAKVVTMYPLKRK